MSRDYKSRKSSASKGGKYTLVLGIFIGYTLGIVSAIGIWFYLEQVPSPFLTEPQISGYEGVDGAKDDKKSDIPGSSAEKIVQTNEEAQFDFYDILPGDDAPVTSHETQQAIEKKKVIEKSKPTLAPSTAVPSPSAISVNKKAVRPVESVNNTYYLQVGAFRNNADADNLKARLALLGVIASVRSADLSDKGIWYRVRVGPFTQKARVDDVHHILRENGIEAQFIRTR